VTGDGVCPSPKGEGRSQFGPESTSPPISIFYQSANGSIGLFFAQTVHIN